MSRETGGAFCRRFGVFRRRFQSVFFGNGCHFDACSMNRPSRDKVRPVLGERRVVPASWHAAQGIGSSDQVEKRSVVLFVDVARIEYDIGSECTGETLKPVETAFVAWLRRKALYSGWAMYTTRRMKLEMQGLRDLLFAPRDLLALIRGQHLGRGLHENRGQIIGLIR